MILNIAYPNNSDIQFKVSDFPDGQHQVDIQGCNIGNTCLIKSRINNFIDLEILICAVNSLRNLGVKNIDLYAPYILGSRSDRKFKLGGNNYLKQVISPIINSLKFNSVTCLDPHSDVLEACIDNFKKESNALLVAWALSNIPEEVALVCPDAGAVKKIYSLVDEVYEEGHRNTPEIIFCSKSRDVYGKLSNIIVSEEVKNMSSPLLIVDDICDGGRTFLEQSKVIRNVGYKGDIYLCVTHGIFSAGLKELSENFKKVFTTNSYSDLGDTYQDSYGTIHKHNIKQLNIF